MPKRNQVLPELFRFFRRNFDYPTPGRKPYRPPFDPDQSGPPQHPPPPYTPSHHEKGPGLRDIDPGAIRPCMYRYSYIWLENGRHFWAWITYIGRKSIAGWKWTGYRWVYFGIDLDKIESFVCY